MRAQSGLKTGEIKIKLQGYLHLQLTGVQLTAQYIAEEDFRTCISDQEKITYQVPVFVCRITA